MILDLRLGFGFGVGFGHGLGLGLYDWSFVLVLVLVLILGPLFGCRSCRVCVGLAHKGSDIDVSCLDLNRESPSKEMVRVSFRIDVRIGFRVKVQG